MVSVKLFGILRLKTGIVELKIEDKMIREAAMFSNQHEASDRFRVSDLLPLLLAEAKRRDPDIAVTIDDFKNCVVMINEKQSGLKDCLQDGDRVVLLSPVGGG